MQGTIFDIKEFAINDGPGIRVTVFMKGCPLRCQWCHNPEGLTEEPQQNTKTGAMVGKLYTVDELVNKIKKFEDVFEISNGGVTFSGGEPTQQAEFIYEVAKKLPNIHKTLDTSGYCDSEKFKKLLSVFDLVYFDLKLIDDEKHKQHTEVSNNQILENLKLLDESNLPYHIRIPLIPNITDTEDNMNQIYNIIISLKNKPLRVDTLPYNILAGGKYKNYGLTYALENSETKNNLINIDNFKTKLKKQNINTIGEDVKCLQNA